MPCQIAAHDGHKTSNSLLCRSSDSIASLQASCCHNLSLKMYAWKGHWNARSVLVMSLVVESKMEIKIRLQDQSEARALFGPQDQYLRAARQATGAQIVLKANVLSVTGEKTQVEECRELLRKWRAILRTNQELLEEDVQRSLDPETEGNDVDSESESIDAESSD